MDATYKLLSEHKFYIKHIEPTDYKLRTAEAELELLIRKAKPKVRK